MCLRLNDNNCSRPSFPLLFNDEMIFGILSFYIPRVADRSPKSRAVGGGFDFNIPKHWDLK